MLVYVAELCLLSSLVIFDQLQIYSRSCLQIVINIILTFILLAEKWNSGEKIGERVRTQH